jgi:molybdopterin synthase sulfur carrier subunit
MARVLLFGRLADVAGWRERVFDPTPERLSALRSRVGRESAELAAALAGPGVQAAVDRALARGDPHLDGVAEVAFLPPMSGG